ncbi:Clavaminate synthase-like protein [Cryphonectria parasitica EP155]|uniref:Clavaminate synthase-like protein n=1 Tax=Cryphonectria parasitica (strain ATCC 38755 / EP155) TaxID=660469 RepID=A0A9P4Y065_CRYP1|nr:Clavaminate synthase-like protein [Cryphonectria parasitica EP155]KAF3763975.1 Clavaminate synthase-like protein [Cryphonectria parasitica EP155]
MSSSVPNGAHLNHTTYPPFPKDVPSVKLETFSLARLEAGDKALEDRLFQTCRERGFFYLDLSGSSVSSMQQDADDLVKLAEKVHRLPQEEKEKYPMRDSIFGFKPIGATKTDAQGTPDTAGFFNISKDAILENTDRWPLPQLVLDEKPMIARYMRNAHGTGLKIMTILVARLGLPPDALERYHRITEESGDHVRLTHGPPRRTAELPEIQTPGHTDFGTITILFNWLGGLQVCSAGSAEKPRWLWVEPPPPNHAIVNLGDATVKWTGGVLCSGRHRVVPAPGEQGKFERYSIVYFVRPENKAVLKRLEAAGIPKVGPDEVEEEITAKEWILQQARGLGQSIAN